MILILRKLLVNLTKSSYRYIYIIDIFEGIHIDNINMSILASLIKTDFTVPTLRTSKNAFITWFEVEQNYNTSTNEFYQ